ncbi:hypothetical protein COOONC_19541 [Cooperia oncophora]
MMRVPLIFPICIARKGQGRTDEKEFGATNEWRSKQTSSPKPKPKSYAPTPTQYENAPTTVLQKSPNISSVPQPRPNRWEMPDNEYIEVVKPEARHEPPSSSQPQPPVRTDSSANTFAHPPPPIPRYRSAFQSLEKFVGGIQEERNEYKPHQENRAPINNETSQTRNLYERRGNADYQQDRNERKGSTDYKQEQYQRRGNADYQQDRNERRGDTDYQQDQYQRRGNTEFQRDRNAELDQDRNERRGSAGFQQERYDRRGTSELQQDRDGYSRNDRADQSYREAFTGRESRIRDDQSFRSVATDRRFDDDYRDRSYSQNNRLTPDGSRVRPSLHQATDASIFNQPIDESCIRREPPRAPSRSTVIRERSPLPSERLGFVGSTNRPRTDTQYSSGSTGFPRDGSRDYDQRGDRDNYRGSDYSMHKPLNDVEGSATRTSGFTSRQDSRQQSVQSPTASVGPKNDSKRLVSFLVFIVVNG